jgi:hypothetical protein
MSFWLPVFSRRRGKMMDMLVQGDRPNPTCSYFGSVGLVEYHFAPAGNGRLKAISKAVGFTHGDEGAKTIWEPIPEDRQFEIPKP